MLAKIAILALLAAILVALFSGLRYMLKSGGNGDRRMVRALSWRVGLQVALIAFLALAAWQGWIRPHSVNGSVNGPIGDRPAAAPVGAMPVAPSPP